MRWVDNVRILSLKQAPSSLLESWQTHISHRFHTYSFGSGREALFALLQQKNWASRVVLLPAFVPEGVYYPFLQEAWEVIFYELDEAGNPDFEDIARRIAASPPAIAVLIHLFGVARDATRFKAALPEHTLFIEDFAHTMLGDWLGTYEMRAGIGLFSPPKLLGVSDGCFLLCKDQWLFSNIKNWSPARSLYLFFRMGALSLASASTHCGQWDRYNLLDRLGARFYNWAYLVLMAFCQQPHSFSGIGQWLLARTPQQTAATKRQQQAFCYQQGLSNKQIQILYPAEGSPMPLIGFPIKVSKRQHFALYLYQKGVRGAAYAPKWWFVPPGLESEYPLAHNLWATHYVLPINQKLNEKDIRYVVDLVNQYSNPTDEQEI